MTSCFLHNLRRRRFCWSLSKLALVSCRRRAWRLDLLLGRSLESVVHDSGSMLKSFRSRFSTSLNRSLGLPVCLVPSSSTPCSRRRGILSQGILLTCPAHRSRKNFNLEESGPEPVILNTSSFVILSSQVFPRMKRRLNVWKALSFDAWGLYVAQLSAP